MCLCSILEIDGKKKELFKNFSREKAVNLLLYFCVLKFFFGGLLGDHVDSLDMKLFEFYQIVSKF